MIKDICVIGFDLDGTLYPSTPEIQSRIRGKIYEKISLLINVPFEKSKELFETKYNKNHSGSRVMNEIAQEYAIENLNSSEFIQEALQEADFLDLIKPNKALEGMIGRLLEKYDKKIDLITGSTYSFALQKLGRLELDYQNFGVILSRKDGSKTSGEMFEKWMNMRNSFSPENFLYVGDNKKQDIKSPNSLGIKTCFVGKDKTDSVADFNINNILELEDLLK